MPENNPPDPPPAKRNKKGLIQSNAEARSATKNTSKKPPKKILPPPQIEESSESVELAAGETPSASPIEKTATDPKMTMQVPVCQVTYAGLRAIDGIQPVYQPSERPENHFFAELADMKKPTLRFEEKQPRNIQRADIAPSIGYAIVVDGHFKTQFSDESAAKKAANELLSNYPMLQIEIYNATAKTRTLMK